MKELLKKNPAAAQKEIDEIFSAGASGYQKRIEDFETVHYKKRPIFPCDLTKLTDLPPLVLVGETHGPKADTLQRELTERANKGEIFLGVEGLPSERDQLKGIAGTRVTPEAAVFSLENAEISQATRLLIEAPQLIPSWRDRLEFNGYILGDTEPVARTFYLARLMTRPNLIQAMKSVIKDSEILPYKPALDYLYSLKYSNPMELLNTLRSPDVTSHQLDDGVVPRNRRHL